ncbi:murein hydrolase activator EnvC family protein [Desulfonatronovibrio hydrogenovorans]|uniref:murein hydrolase activator EnvC family protein n=1 Tax=Desulfonatronovibrio hydrogenovorans TaxID=53245 RepID=UPI000490E153|nr:peptidoglycan DD-metalloendopeptidase family protein [Desulfonatronovibrio hydrogenovorans]
MKSLLFFLLVLFWPVWSLAERPGSIQSEIEARQDQLERQQRAIDRLSQQEREAYSRLARAEDRLDKINNELEAQEGELREILSQEAQLAARYNDLVREKSETQKKLAEILEDIWPIFLESQGRGLGHIQQWTDLDRQMTWLRAFYLEAEEIYSLLQEQSGELASNLAGLQILKASYQDKLAQVNRTKDRMLGEKLSFLNELQEIRAQRLAGEEMIDQILDVIDSLNYQLRAVTEREFEGLKGHLSWPVHGDLVATYQPSSEPPHNGLSISVPENSPIRAISWGKVVHNDTLRGFGRVVIIFHGADYYTLYAYLSESNLQIGQEVEKDEVIGRAGYYPQINAHGIYFELRFRQKAINPVPWLAKS